MTDIQAALGISQLKRLDNIVRERNIQLKFYYEILKNLPITFLEIPPNVYSSVHLAIIRLNKISTNYYSKIFEGMRQQNIGVQLHYKPIYKQAFYRNFSFNKELFPGSEDYESSAISIPLFPGLKRKQQIRVKNALEKLL